jgi:putative membrane protein
MCFTKPVEGPFRKLIAAPDNRDRSSPEPATMTDLLLATLHHLLAFTLVALLAAQYALLRPPLASLHLARLGRLDAAYGACAVLLIAIGIARLAWGARGADYYLSDPWFWAKMTAFAAIAGLSVVPTLTLIKWRRLALVDPAFAPTADARQRVRRFIAGELALVPVVLVCAAAMARYGTF